MSGKRIFSSLVQKRNWLKLTSLLCKDSHPKPGAFACMQISPFHPSFVEQVFKHRPPWKGFASEGGKLETEHTWKFMHDPSQPELLSGGIWPPSYRQAPRWLVPKHIQQLHTNELFFRQVLMKQRSASGHCDWNGEEVLERVTSGSLSELLTATLAWIGEKPLQVSGVTPG